MPHQRPGCECDLPGCLPCSCANCSKAGGGMRWLRVPSGRTRKYETGNDRWVPEVLISGPVVFLCRLGNAYSTVDKRLWVDRAACTVRAGVGECALEMGARRIISRGPGEPVAVLYGLEYS